MLTFNALSYSAGQVADLCFNPNVMSLLITKVPLLTTTVEDVVSVLHQRAGSACHIVGVDGFMGAGKTALACELAELLGGMRVSLDSYASLKHTEIEDYAANIMQHYLISDMRKLKVTFPFVVVEGICLLEVLAALSESPDSIIYVKRISAMGLWHDGYQLEDYETNQSIHENCEGLNKSEFEYHTKWRPHEHAHVVFERSDKETS